MVKKISYSIFIYLYISYIFIYIIKNSIFSINRINFCKNRNSNWKNRIKIRLTEFQTENPNFKISNSKLTKKNRIFWVYPNSAHPYMYWVGKRFPVFFIIIIIFLFVYKLNETLYFWNYLLNNYDFIWVFGWIFLFFFNKERFHDWLFEFGDGFSWLIEFLVKIFNFFVDKKKIVIGYLNFTSCWFFCIIF